MAVSGRYVLGDIGCNTRTNDRIGLVAGELRRWLTPADCSSIIF